LELNLQTLRYYTIN